MSGYLFVLLIYCNNEDYPLIINLFMMSIAIHKATSILLIQMDYETVEVDKHRRNI